MSSHSFSASNLSNSKQKFIKRVYFQLKNPTLSDKKDLFEVLDFYEYEYSCVQFQRGKYFEGILHFSDHVLFHELESMMIQAKFSTELEKSSMSDADFAHIIANPNIRLEGPWISGQNSQNLKIPGPKRKFDKQCKLMPDYGPIIVQEIENFDDFWSLYDELIDENFIFSQNRSLMLQAFKDGKLFGIFITETDSMKSRNSFQQDPIFASSCHQHIEMPRSLLVPGFCVKYNEDTAIMLWVHYRCRGLGLGKKFVQSLGIKNLSGSPTMWSVGFWERCGVKFHVPNSKSSTSTIGVGESVIEEFLTKFKNSPVKKEVEILNNIQSILKRSDLESDDDEDDYV